VTHHHHASPQQQAGQPRTGLPGDLAEPHEKTDGLTQPAVLAWNVTDAVELVPLDEDSYYQDPVGFFARLRESRPVAPVGMPFPAAVTPRPGTRAALCGHPAGGHD
jgi:hypothetical protein